MKKKKILAGLLVCALIGGAVPYNNYVMPESVALTASAVDYTEGTYESLEYRKYSDHVEISICDRSATEVIIPNEIEDLPVTSIGDDSFRDCSSLTSITIPDSVISIGNMAFLFCESLTSITIHDSVTSIGYGAFAGCTDLTSITIPDSVTNIEASAFSNCSSLTSITIPESVTSIGTHAFSDCSNLTEINVSDKNKNYISKDGVLFNKDMTNLLQYPNGKIETEYIIPDGVTSIGDDSFRDCSGLTEVTIPDSVTSIGDDSFRDCSGLTEVTIPDSVTSIGFGAFEGCANLTSITIPDSVTSIEGSTFIHCTGLTEVTIPDSVTSIGYSAFSDCSNLTSITIPESVTSIGTHAFSDCSNLTEISVSDKNKNYISKDGVLFNKDMTNLLQYPNGKIETEYIIPDGVTIIESSAFDNCIGLTSITIPDSVTSIGESAFLGCTDLTLITIPDSVTNIKAWAFSHCSSLTSITIPDSVTSIGYSAFEGCANLTEITIKNPECEICDYESTILNYDGGYEGTIYGYDNSTAQAYAEKYERNFVNLGEAPIKGSSVNVAGDANGDGTADIADVVAVASYIGDSKNNPLDSQAIINCDVQNTGDGLTTGDILMIQQYIAQILDNLSAE